MSKVYSEQEIVQIFKNAHLNQNRIKLIQELTLMDKREVVEILERNNCEILPSDLSKESRRKIIEKMVLDMYLKGYSDFKISQRIGMSEMYVCNLRSDLRLKPNRGKKVEKMPTAMGE